MKTSDYLIWQVLLWKVHHFFQSIYWSFISSGATPQKWGHFIVTIWNFFLKNWLGFLGCICSKFCLAYFGTQLDSEEEEHEGYETSEWKGSVNSKLSQPINISQPWNEVWSHSQPTTSSNAWRVNHICISIRLESDQARAQFSQQLLSSLKKSTLLELERSWCACILID